MKTSELIAKLSEETKPIKTTKTPFYWVKNFILALVIYYVFAQVFLGFRSDIAQKFSQPLFIAEILLILALLVSSVVAVVLMLYPDNYQKSYLLKIPFAMALFLAILFCVEFLLLKPAETGEGEHSFQCSLCIASFAVIPTIAFFYILRQGANINHFSAAIFSIIAASTIGCLALRMSEQNDSIVHLITWHYFPIIVFSLLGAALSKNFFKW